MKASRGCGSGLDVRMHTIPGSQTAIRDIFDQALSIEVQMEDIKPSLQTHDKWFDRAMDRANETER